MDYFNKYDALVRFVYRDSDADEARAIAEKISSDLEMRVMRDELLMAKMELPKVQFNPAPATINNVLAYARMAAAWF